MDTVLDVSKYFVADCVICPRGGNRMTNDTQTTPTVGATHALREVVEDIQSRDTLLSVHDI